MNYNGRRKKGKEHYFGSICRFLAVFALFWGMAAVEVNAQIGFDFGPVPILSDAVPRPPAQVRPTMPAFPAELPTTEQLRTALERQLELRRSDSTLVETISPATVLKMTGVYGAETRFLCRVASNANAAGTATEPVYAVGILCWSIPAGGRTLLSPTKNGMIPKVGYGYQRTGGEMLAILAEHRIADDYPIRLADETPRTLADLVQAEKRLASYYGDQALRAAGLAGYLTDANLSWTGRFGETLSLASLAEYELARPVLWNRREAVIRLIGLTRLWERFKREIDAGTASPEITESARALEKFFALVRPWVLSLADEQSGLWTGSYFSPAPESPDPVAALESSAAILRWLFMTAADDEIRSETTRRRVWNLGLLLAKTIPANTQPANLSDRQIDALTDALAVFMRYLEKTAP